MMRCKRCGTVLEEDMFFCPECGCPVDKAAVPLDEEVPNAGPENDVKDIADEISENREGSDSAPPAWYAGSTGSQQPEVEDIFSVSNRERGPVADSVRIDTRTSSPTRSYFPDEDPEATTRLYEYDAPSDRGVDLGGYGSRTSADSGHKWDSIPELFPEPGVVPEADRASTRRGRTTQYGDGYDQRSYAGSAMPDADRSDIGDGYNGDESEDERAYPRVSAVKRVASIFLCILMALVLLFTALMGALRLTLTHDNIRDAADSDKLAEKSIVTDIGVIPSVEYAKVRIGVDTVEKIGLKDDMIKEFLRKSAMADLFGDLMCDYSDFIFSGKEPDCLNSDYIIGKVESINDTLADVSGHDIKMLGESTLESDINGGDLSFLSIDGSGGWFRVKYGVSPSLISTVGSLPVLIISIAMVLLCAVFLIVINSSNPPFGLRCNAVVMIITGSFYLLVSVGLWILTMIKDIWIVSDMMIYLALRLGAISLGVLAVGIVLAIVSKAVAKRAQMKKAGLSHIG